MASPKDLISWKLDAVFLEGRPSDLLAAGPFVWRSRGNEALTTVSVGLGGSEESAAVGLHPQLIYIHGCITRPLTRRWDVRAGVELGRCGRGGPVLKQGRWKSGALPATRRRKFLIKLNLGFSAGRSSGCSSQASAVAAVQSGGANRSSTSEENI